MDFPPSTPNADPTTNHSCPPQNPSYPVLPVSCNRTILANLTKVHPNHSNSMFLPFANTILELCFFSSCFCEKEHKSIMQVMPPPLIDESFSTFKCRFFHKFGCFSKWASQDLFFQVGVWFGEGGGLQTSCVIRVPSQQLTYVVSLFYWSAWKFPGHPPNECGACP